MTRWNDTCVLLSHPMRVQDEEGNWVQGEQFRKLCYCNPFTLGAVSWSTVVDTGLRADAEIQLRSVDYEGQDEVVYHGREYDVTRVTSSGEFVRLTLGRRLSND